ncbi:MAG: hypothetical protein KDB03_15535 [Planctomycetales bacterium]|nr:hypothetical protein [Planctomycetales bacterium]
MDLLVSVKNLHEAQLVIEQGVSWVDLKDPGKGSLGSPDLAIVREVSDWLCAQHSHRLDRFSIALGEQRELELDEILKRAECANLLKVGLSGLMNIRNWQERLLRISESIASRQAKLIPVYYADDQRAQCPSLKEIVELSQQIAASHFLVDTFVKDGQTLFEFCSAGQLGRLKEKLNDFGCRLVLAGSLKIEHLPLLAEVQPSMVAIRGAACALDRNGSLCEERVHFWASCLQTSWQAQTQDVQGRAK